MNEMIGVVLAAGLGTRLRPATELCPKPLIPVGGVEPLFFALWKAYQVGLRDFYVNAHHLPRQVQSACTEFQELLPGSRIQVIVEGPEILGTGGALQNIFKKVFQVSAPKDVLVQNGDTLSQFDLSRLVQLKGKSTFAISKRRDHTEKYNKLWIDSAEQFSGVGPTGKRDGDCGVHFLGSYRIAARDIGILLQSLPETISQIDLFRAIFEPLKNLGESPQAVRMFDVEEIDQESHFWFDMTNESYLLEAQTHVTQNLSELTLWGKVLQARFPKGKFSRKGAFALLPEGHEDDLARANILIDPQGSLDKKCFKFLGECGSLVILPAGEEKLQLILTERQENFSTVVQQVPESVYRLHDLSHKVRIIREFS